MGKIIDLLKTKSSCGDDGHEILIDKLYYYGVQGTSFN